MLEIVWIGQVNLGFKNVYWLGSWEFGYIIALTTEILKKVQTSRKLE